MTPLPKRRLSTRRQGDRRSHIKLSLGGHLNCSNCKKPLQRHRVCPHCGYYGGKQVKTPKVKRASKQ